MKILNTDKGVYASQFPSTVARGKRILLNWKEHEATANIQPLGAGCDWAVGS